MVHVHNTHITQVKNINTARQPVRNSILAILADAFCDGLGACVPNGKRKCWRTYSRTSFHGGRGELTKTMKSATPSEKTRLFFIINDEPWAWLAWPFWIFMKQSFAFGFHPIHPCFLTKVMAGTIVQVLIESGGCHAVSGRKHKKPDGM